MRIDIYSDTICPWCFIGKRRLERALAERPQSELTIRWRAFQLNPSMPPEGMDRREYLESKFGGPAGARQIYDHVAEAGKSEKIDFDFEAMRRTPNTIQSHRLIRFATEKGRADDLVEALFESYFLRARDIGERAVLASVAASVGLDEAEVETFLDGDEEREAVKAEDAQARAAGIRGVPSFILNGKFSISGAHPPEVLFQLFDLGRQEAAAE